MCHKSIKPIQKIFICLSTSPPGGVSVPGQMASNTRYAHGSLTRRSWTLPELQGGGKGRNPIELFTHSHFSPNALRVAQSKLNAAWGGELGERGTASGRKEEGGNREGQIPRENTPHRSRSMCVIRKEITASDEGNCKGTRITCLYIVRGGSQESQSQRNETQLLHGCEETPQNVLGITCLWSVFV